jgi:hypothetical protein
MNNKKDYSNNLASRENFLLLVLQKVIKEYKSLLEYSRRNKPLKVVEILSISSIPGESRFTIQVTHKNSIARLTAAEIINSGYKLNDFSDFHAELICQAAQGRLAQFLKSSEMEPIYKIISTKFDSTIQQCIFTIETKENIRFTRTASQLSSNRDLLLNMSKQDVYDVGYSKGSESILNENTSIYNAKFNAKFNAKYNIKKP